MKGYNTTLSYWEGRLILLPRMGSLPAAASKWRPSEPEVDCIIATPAALQCHQFAAGPVTTLCTAWSISTSIVKLSILTHWAVRMAHRHYDCNTLLAITAACILLQACCSHEQLLFMYLFIMHDMNWRSQRRGERAEPSGLDLTTQHKEFENVKVESCL